MVHCPPLLLERVHARVSSPASGSLNVVVAAQCRVVLLRVLVVFDADRLIVQTTAPVLDDDEVRLYVLVAAPVLAAAPVGGGAPTCRRRQKKKLC